MKIADKLVVSITYILKNKDGKILDQSTDKSPLVYLHGSGNIIPGLESSLMGKEVGNEIDTVVTPEDGYGVRQEELVSTVPDSQFEDKSMIKVGVQFQAQTSEGVRIATVSKYEQDQVTIDMNHPLAGETLHFNVKVTEVRVATEEELSHGHVHGPGGHHH